MSAIWLAREGQTTLSGRPVNLPGEKRPRKIESGESVAKGLGFQLTSFTKAFDIYRSLTEIKRCRSENQEELANR